MRLISHVKQLYECHMIHHDINGEARTLQDITQTWNVYVG